MTVPVTVIGSVVACFLSVGFGWANAKGPSSKQARATIVFFIICLPVAVNNYFPFTKGFRSACCTKFRFFSSLAFLRRTDPTSRRGGTGNRRTHRSHVRDGLSHRDRHILDEQVLNLIRCAAHRPLRSPPAQGSSRR